MAVDELVPVGPGDGGLVPIVHQVGEGGSPAHRGLALQIVEDLHRLGPSQTFIGDKGGSAGALHDAVGIGIAHGGFVPLALGGVGKGQGAALVVYHNGVLAGVGHGEG